MGFVGYDIDIPYDLPCYTVYIYIYYLVGGLKHFVFPFSWEESSQLTFIFFRGGETTNQYLL